MTYDVIGVFEFFFYWIEPAPQASNMAVSPLISQSPSGASVSTSTASKAKSLAVRSGSQGAPASPFKNATAASGLSDQMNDNVRRRYVKGMNYYASSLRFLACLTRKYRQKTRRGYLRRRIPRLLARNAIVPCCN